MNTQASIRCCGITFARSPQATLDATLSQPEVQQTYNRLAGIYDLWSYLTESRARKRAFELADLRDGSAVIEVAVGTGVNFEHVVARNPNGENIGIDLTEGMLDKAGQRLMAAGYTNYRLAQGNALEIAYPDGHFDLLFNQYMFDLIPWSQMDALLAEFRRVLKPGGRSVLVNMTEPETVFGGIYKLIYRISPRAMGGCRPVQLAQRLSANGFEVQRREYHQQSLFPSEVVLALKKRD